jgi:hypothetical protein
MDPFKRRLERAMNAAWSVAQEDGLSLDESVDRIARYLLQHRDPEIRAFQQRNEAGAQRLRNQTRKDLHWQCPLHPRATEEAAIADEFPPLSDNEKAVLFLRLAEWGFLTRDQEGRWEVTPVSNKVGAALYAVAIYGQIERAATWWPPGRSARADDLSAEPRFVQPPRT